MSEFAIGRIVRPASVGVRRVWPGEATHFTPSLAENLDWLDPLGLGPLKTVQVEAALPNTGRSLDILAATADGRLIAIKNQYALIDHDHLTRGLAYAVGPHARALIVIAEGHRPEFVAVADYLNRAYEQLGDRAGVAVYLVTLRVDSVGDEYFIPRFDVVARPNTWLEAIAETNAPARLTSVQDFLGLCPPELRLPDETIIAQWLARPGASVKLGQGSCASTSHQLDAPPCDTFPAPSVAAFTHGYSPRRVTMKALCVQRLQ